jgi:hypothetical protein
VWRRAVVHYHPNIKSELQAIEWGSDSIGAKTPLGVLRDSLKSHPSHSFSSSMGDEKTIEKMV